jgi:hypothetical protein
MSDATWLEVVQQALGSYGYALEDAGLADELQRQLKGTAGAMPLVQFALTELWAERDRTTKKIPRAALSAIGGIAGSLERHASRTVAELERAHPGDGPRQILLGLTTPRGTRATVAERELPGEDPERSRIVQALEGARLVVRGPEGVTLAHDALLTEWKLLAQWIAEVREQRVLVEELETEAKKWSRDPEAASPWNRRRLAAAREIAEGGVAKLSEGARSFVRAGVAAERRSRVVAAAVAAAIVVLGAVAGGVYVRKLRADEAAARQVASLERSKASIEASKREELERAQTELDGRQRKIDELVKQLEGAKDPAAIEEVRRQMAEEQARAHAAQERIAAAKRPTVPAATTTPPPAPPPTRGPKIQREDD